MEFEVVLNTGNPGKAREISRIAAERQGLRRVIRVVSLYEATGVKLDVDEDGLTLRDNAAIKARAAKRALAGFKPKDGVSRIVAADDSGLFVDCLGGRPGVHTARYAGLDATQAEKNRKLLEEIASVLQGVSQGVSQGAARSASFRCAIAIIFPDGSECFAEGTCAGEISMEPAGDNGFGYDPIFYLPGLRRTMAELTPDEKNLISHRGIAVRRMIDEIEKHTLGSSI